MKFWQMQSPCPGYDPVTAIKYYVPLKLSCRYQLPQLGLRTVGGQERLELNLSFSYSTILVEVPTSHSQCGRDFYSKLIEYER